MNLKPQTFNEYIGQDKIKDTLKVIINSAKKRKKQLDHILLFGKSGIGKTTLASIIANEYSRNIRFAQGPSLEKKSDLLALIGSIQKSDIIFIDEIHALNKGIEELLYSVLDEGVIDIVLGPEGDSRIMRLVIPDFTLIGATTKLNELSAPFKNRFGIVFKLKNYNLNEMETIVKKLALKMNKGIGDKAVKLIATSSRSNPRIAINIFKRVLDFTIDSKIKKINKKITIKTFNLIGIYKNGLEDIHIEYLKTLTSVFGEKSASLENISSIMQEEKKSIEILIEPALIELKYIEKSSRGRKISKQGENYLATYKLHNV